MVTHRAQSWLLADWRIVDPDERAAQQLLARRLSRLSWNLRWRSPA